jgi:Rps23 Pro-64 3,4-dihydroxylase Tpa1-like proline 4-hydroxylase
MTDSFIRLQLLLSGGHTQQIELEQNSPELSRLFRVLSSRHSAGEGPGEEFFQLPMLGGKEAFSFRGSQLVAINTHPPVLIEFEEPVPPEPPEPSGHDNQPVESVQPQRPEVLIIDDFMGPGEHRDMLAHALQTEHDFDKSTVTSGLDSERQNTVILQFAQQAHSTLICNRLLTWLPQILHRLRMAHFPVQQVESQLTASNDGHYYRSHLDRDENSQIERVLTCIYYFGKEPAQFSGGALRLYDSICHRGVRHQAETYRDIQPAPNRMVIFPSDNYHELMPIRCPSHKFEDSRFAVTNWIWGMPDPDSKIAHGWGHMRCGEIPDNFSLRNDENS